MHIPDNYLSPSTCVVLGAAMIPVWKRAAVKVKNEISRKKLPMLGVCAAFSFLTMMFNVPVPGGTSAHAVGSALIAILLGPWAAVISITIALVIQALFFGDGGILALGANTFNMAFIMPFTAYYTYKLIKGNSQSDKRSYAAAFIAGYLSINLAALCAAVQFGIQPLLFKDNSGLPLYCPYSLKFSIPAMLIPHLLVAGFVEGIVSAGVLAYIKRVSPESVYGDDKLSIKPLYVLIFSMILLTPIGLFAAGTAWGEWNLTEMKKLNGFIPQGMKNGVSFNAIMKDYLLAGHSEKIGYIASAVVGVILILVIFKIINRLISKKQNTAED
ncbi:MAG: cobalt transporter CbiM [Bacillota bacterium]|nr:cobalt transporter CbiM [Bacillota bacterium]